MAKEERSDNPPLHSEEALQNAKTYMISRGGPESDGPRVGISIHHGWNKISLPKIKILRVATDGIEDGKSTSHEVRFSKKLDPDKISLSRDIIHQVTLPLVSELPSLGNITSNISHTHSSMDIMAGYDDQTFLKTRVAFEAMLQRMEDVGLDAFIAEQQTKEKPSWVKRTERESLNAQTVEDALFQIQKKSTGPAKHVPNAALIEIAQTLLPTILQNKSRSEGRGS